MTGADRLAAAFAPTPRSRPLLVPFLAAGDPDPATTVALAAAAAHAGAGVIELGSPFSDPLADGPVIQAAYDRALANGATTATTLACADEVAARTGLPVVLMVAVNCVLSYGTARFCRDAAAAGVSGLLVPDLPLEAAGPVRDAAAVNGLGTVFLSGPDSGPDRIAAAAEASTGFVYLVRRRGVTGAGAPAEDLHRRVSASRGAARAPVAVGFGIATPDDVREVVGIVDGVIVGSALVDAAHAAAAGTTGAEARRRAAEEVERRVRELRSGVTTETMGAGT